MRKRRSGRKQGRTGKNARHDKTEWKKKPISGSKALEKSARNNLNKLSNRKVASVVCVCVCALACVCVCGGKLAKSVSGRAFSFHCQSTLLHFEYFCLAKMMWYSPKRRFYGEKKKRICTAKDYWRAGQVGIPSIIWGGKEENSQRRIFFSAHV